MGIVDLMKGLQIRVPNTVLWEGPRRQGHTGTFLNTPSLPQAAGATVGSTWRREVLEVLLTP